MFRFIFIIFIIAAFIIVVPKVGGFFFFFHNFPSSCDVSRGVRCLTPDGFGEQKIEMPNRRVMSKKQKLTVDEVASVKKRVGVRRILKGITEL